ncbi:hypothetical protein [Mesorhizobium cantuariense]|uniref:Uncharacterized protein n=1 Tax=Mesorhizobium cantuariense TaxID=1300275 RepID=A0ABV7MHL5_9HYPH
MVIMAAQPDRSWMVLPGAVMPCDRRALFWADLPRDAVCDPASSPQQRVAIFFPAAAPLLAQQQDRHAPSFACAAA